MATQVLHHVDVSPTDAMSHFRAVYTGPLAAFPGFESTIFSRPLIDLKISRVETLHGAKSAMVAIGLETVAAFCLLGAWLIWHFLR